MEFYLTGCIIAFCIACYEAYKVWDNPKADYSPFAVMVLCSWLTVGLYIWRYIR